MELLNRVIVILLTFWGNSLLFPIVSEPIYIPIDGEQRFPFIHIFSNTCYFLSVVGNISCFWFSFLWWLLMFNIFFYLTVDHWMPFFGKVSIQILYPCFNQIICGGFFIVIELYNFLSYLDVNFLSDIWFAKISHILLVAFSFCYLFCCVELLSLT